jgi:hypothetical protein
MPKPALGFLTSRSLKAGEKCLALGLWTGGGELVGSTLGLQALTGLRSPSADAQGGWTVSDSAVLIAAA